MRKIFVVIAVLGLLLAGGCWGTDCDDCDDCCECCCECYCDCCCN